tara:strand:- start:102 stop:524 length:423 start_codon:yes stop_codon:yes gene_type:complete
MADLIIYTNEKIILNDTDRGVLTTQTISGINNIDNRILNIPSGSNTTLFTLSNGNGAGTFITSSIQYVRITNTSTTVPVKLIISSSTEAMSYSVSAGSSYTLSTSKMTGSLSSLIFNDITSIQAQPSGSSATIEYFIATT